MCYQNAMVFIIYEPLTSPHDFCSILLFILFMSLCFRFQVKQLSNSLKRKSDSNAANDEDGPSPPRLQPIRDHPSALPTNQTETGYY